MNEPRPSHRRVFQERLGLAHKESAPRNPAINLPAVVIWLIAINTFIFAVQTLGPQKWALIVDFTLGFRPWSFSNGLANNTDALQLSLPLFGHMFVHANIPHLTFNMMWLIVFGAGVARRLGVEVGGKGMGLYNTSLFISFYLVCGVAGAMAYYLRMPESPTIMVGASGAISGLMGASMRFALRPLTPYGITYGPLASIFARPVLMASAIYIGINLLTGLGMKAVSGGMMVAWDAHIGGYVFGLLAFPLFDMLAQKGTGPAGRVS